MLTRRRVLHQAVRTAAATTLWMSPVGALLHAEARQQQHAADEMTLNTSQQQVHYPPPDFGPLPAELPRETRSLAGSASLKAHAARHGVIAGAAVVVRALENDPALDQLIVDQYGILVPEGELKWVALRPTQASFDFTAADNLFQFAHQHQLLVRGHTLVWHNSVPQWLERNAASLNVRQLLVDHIQTVMGRYRGRVHSWDVVNEAILPKDGQPGGLRKSFWYEHVGPDYIDLAFRTARAADSHAHLTYNDYGVETSAAEDTERRRLILDLLRGMQQRKVPLDAVGIQSHIKAASPNTIGQGLADYIAAIQAMGLEVYLTEMDVNEDDIVSSDVHARDQLVAFAYSDLLQVALANPAVKLMLIWGVSDRRTWLNDGPTHHRKQPLRPQRSLPFDPDYRPTSAFFAIRTCFDHMPDRRPTTPARKSEGA
jgi:endo-1,4-beta-xylanase